jgi:hypothetical protein
LKTALIAALVAAAPAQQAQRPCLTEAQVEDLTLFALPPLLEAMATRCGPSLPADAYLLNGGKTLSQQLAGQSAARWPGARSALSVIAEDKFPPELSAETARSLVRDLASSQMLGKVKPEECARINRVADLLSPLPPANLAGLVATFADMVGKDATKDGKKTKSGPAICPAAKA